MRYLLILLMLTGCMPAFDEHIGRSTDELVTEWGPPDSAYEKEDGTVLLSYSAQKDREGATYWCRVVYASKDGTVVSREVKGNIGGCVHLKKKRRR